MLEKKQYLAAIAVGFLLGNAGCLLDQPLPFLGECADTQGLAVYEYGQINVGRCLSGPTQIQVLQHSDDPDDYHLLVVNSNFEANFADGSLLAIPFAGLDLTRETNYLHEVDARALSVDSFPAGFDVSLDGRYALVSDRRADKLMGEELDRVYTVDLQGLSGGGELVYADRGDEIDEQGRSYTTVPTDPFTVVTHPDSGLVYVLTLTSHQVTVLDEAQTPLATVDVVGSGDASDPVFEDVDGSGSFADYHLDAFLSSAAQDEQWSVRYREGQYRLFTADDGALWRIDAPDARSWQWAVAADLRPDDLGAWADGGLGRASVVRGDVDGVPVLRMWIEGIDASGRPAIGATETATNWSVDWELGSLESPVLEAHGEHAADGVGEPWILVDDDEHLLAYTAHAPAGRTIGVAPGDDDGRAFALLGAPALEPADAGWDDDEVWGPALLRWALTDEDLLYYTGSDGAVPSIGLAIGADGGGFGRVTGHGDDDGRVLGPGEPGSWDAAGVAYPAVIQDLGRFHMFYAGTDGTSWALGHATSFDGVRWQRDPANPVATELTDGSVPPVVAAMKASDGGYFRVEGTISGNIAEAAGSGDPVAEPGQGFVNLACPLAFTIVDGQLLGIGEDGDAWEDGSAAPALVIEGDGSLTMVYETVEDDRHLLGTATSDDGLVFARGDELALDDAALDGLAGIGSPALLDDDDAPGGPVRWLAYEGWTDTTQAIHLARGDQAADAPFAAVAAGAPVLERGGEAAWDETAVGSPSLVRFDGALWLFYEGTSGPRSQIGAARYDEDSARFVRVDGDDAAQRGLVFRRGDPGGWDDGWVGSPHVWVENGRLEMVYAASDNVTVRIGRASSDDGIRWTRRDTGAAVDAVLGPDEVGFDDDGLVEPFVLTFGGQRRMWYEGRTTDATGATIVPRIGGAVERDADTWVKAYRPLGFDDGYLVDTERGDTEAASSIDLGDDISLIVDGVLVHGSGVSDMAVTPDGGFLLISNKLYDNIYVIDVRDDTAEGFVDANYHGIEAILQVPNHYAVTGTRGMAFSSDGERLYLLLAPLIKLEDATRAYGAEAVLVLDLTRLEDTDEPEVLDDLVIGYAATARGVEEDAGNPSIISGGPTNLVLSPDETLAYVAHYNDNSVHVYQLDLGRDPVLVDVIEGTGDEPFDLTLSPDGRTLFVANYVGELEGAEQNVVHSTITVIDVDPASPSYHRVVTTLRNRDAW